MSKFIPLNHDEDYNHESAAAAQALIMKMDHDEAVGFIRMVVGEVLEDTIEANQRSVRSHVRRTVAHREAQVSKALKTLAAQGDERALEYATALDEVSKAARNPYDHGYQFRETDFRRGQDGRFQRKIKQPGPNAPRMSNHQAAALGLPVNTGHSPKARQQYQAEYLQIAQFLGGIESAGGKGASFSDVTLTLRNKATGERYIAKPDTKGGEDNMWDPEMEAVEEVSITPKGMKNMGVGGAALGVTEALGGSMRQGTPGTINRVDQNFGSFADSWSAAGQGRPEQRTYDRISAGSKLVGESAPAGSKAWMAAKFGEFVGAHGPQAEKAFGPAAMKTAYRYRGTEKKNPEGKVVSAYGVAVQQSKNASAQSSNFKNVGQMSAARVAAERRAPTDQELGAGREVIENYFRGTGRFAGDQPRIPTKELYALHLDSGRTPPSEGFLLNKDGQIITQAAGYGDDHYLPFNLKNIGQLKGGEYMRTRSVGGPTSEDIYTGLMGGAKRATVVSRSGTFMVEFNPEGTGGKRHGDQSKRITRHYEQILDSIQSETVDRADISPARRAAIVQSVKEDTEGWNLSSSERRKLVDERIEEYKKNPDFDELEERLVQIQVGMAARNAPRDFDMETYVAQVKNEILQEKETKFRLNGEGYAAALKALEEQFPYHIKVRSVPRREPGRLEAEKDKGYVEPGRARPTNAKAGFHGTKVNQGQKSSASRSNYQRGKYGSNSSETATEVAAAGGATAAAAAVRESGGGNKPAEIAEKIQDKREYRDAALVLREKIYGDLKPDSQQDSRVQAAMALDNADLDTPRGRAAMETLAGIARSNPSLSAKFRTQIAAYDVAAGNLSRVEYNKADALNYGKVPYKFTERAYKAGAPDAEKRKEASAINARTKSALSKTVPLMALTDDELKYEFETTKALYEVAEGTGGAKLDMQEARRTIAAVGVDVETPGGKAVRLDSAMLISRMEDIHRARALNKGVPNSERAKVAVNNGEARTRDKQGEVPSKQTGDFKSVQQGADSLNLMAKTLERYANSVPRLSDDLLDAVSEFASSARESARSGTLEQMNADAEHLRDLEKILGNKIFAESRGQTNGA